MTTKIANPHTGLKVKAIKITEKMFDEMVSLPNSFNVLPYGKNEVQIHSREHRRMVARKLDGKFTGFIYS